MTLNRRNFLTTSATAAATLAMPRIVTSADSTRKKIAFLGTEVRQHSHAQHFLDRLAMGYTWGGQWQSPRLDIASVFIDQFPKGDLAKARIEKYGLKRCTSIKDALTLGTGKLAVDGVVIIAEHGDYPTNELGQKRYPRYEWFKEVVHVFEKTGRAVPVFNDKHLSTVWDECAEMVSDSKRLGFPFLAGSSLPVTRRMPPVEMPFDTPLTESVCICYGGIDSYDIHGLETAQCMSERRKGGEVGIRNVLALKGEKLWTELAKPERETTRKLMVSAMTRSHNLPVDGGYPAAPVSFEWARKTMPNSIGYLIEHLDGFRTSMFITPILDFNYAGLRKDNGEIISTQMYLPMPGRGSTTADFFNPLARQIESLVMTGKSPTPIERTLLTSGMVIAGVESLHSGKVCETPKMKVKYTANKESQFRQD